VVLLFMTSVTWAASLTLAWNPVAGATGYRLYYGTASRTYISNVNAGANTQATATGLTSGQRYYFAVTAYNGAGESGYSTEVNAVAPSPPVASFTANQTSGQLPLAVTFNSGGSTGTITSYGWTFGDGGTSTSANPTRTYTTPGTFTVALTVSGPGGSNTQTRTGYITITRAPGRDGPNATAPTASFVADVTSGAAPLSVNFTNLSSGTIESYAWTFGDGSTSTAANPSHAYASPGIYTVALTATGPNGSNVRTRTGYIAVSPTGTPRLTKQTVSLDLHAAKGTDSNRNGVVEPGESVTVEPVWRNDTGSTVVLNGTISRFTGPAGATYRINDRTTSYGPIAPGEVTDCRAATGNCYRVTVGNAPTRPAQHWDATLQETLSTGNVATITVHVGHSFDDVPVSDASYVFVETALHNNVMSAFDDGTFRPTANSSRSETMSSVARTLVAPAGDVDVLPVSARVGEASYNCASGGTSLFADVAPTDDHCIQIHFLAGYGIDTSFGCPDASHACPAAGTTRAMMAVLTAGAAAGSDANVPVSGTFTHSGSARSYNCASGGSSRFADVTVASPYCRHVNYLWATGAIDVNFNNSFYPSALVTRGQVAEFLTRGMGLTLD
jgi:PKD repeat protein